MLITKKVRVLDNTYASSWLNELRGVVVDVCRDEPNDALAIKYGYWYLESEYNNQNPRKVIMERNFEDFHAEITDSRHENNPHYHKGNIDVWKYMRENESVEANIGFHKGNAIKYITRFGKKKGYNPADLDKVIDAVEALRQICIEEGLIEDGTK